MKKSTTEPMDPSKQFCPNETCRARGKIEEGTIRIHSYHPQRYRCWTCKKTCSARRGTMMEGLQTDEETVTKVVTLLAYGCPTQAIVHAYGLDKRTVADWQNRAGKQCQRVHHALVSKCLEEWFWFTFGDWVMCDRIENNRSFTISSHGAFPYPDVHHSLTYPPFWP